MLSQPFLPRTLLLKLSGMNDVLGDALFDYFKKKSPNKLWIHNNYGKKEEMPVAAYFRNAVQMPEMELVALEHCGGSILDIGAGAGSHALLLQQKGLDVSALDISSKATKIMKLRGVEKIVQQDVFTFKSQRFDTLLLLMNGIGLTGNIQRLSEFMQHAKSLTHPKGQIIFDSSDVAYLYNGNIPETDKYYGEISYCYEYKNQRSGWFSWLYVDRDTLTAIAAKEGWNTEILFEDEYDQYLARLTQK